MTFVTSALVLYSQPLGERDVRLRLLSPERGLFEVVAKGGKRSKKRFVNILEPFSFLRVHVRQGRVSHLPPFLDQADLLEAFERLRSSFLHYLKASYFCEIVESLFKPHTGQEAFKPLLKGLYILAGERDFSWPLFKLHFELQMLARSGFMPRFKECVRCGQKPQTERFFSFKEGGVVWRFFSFKEGGVVCKNCFHEGDFLFPPAVHTFLGHLLQMPVEKLSRLRPAAENLKQAGKIIENFLLFVVDREINSLRILKEML